MLKFKNLFNNKSCSIIGMIHVQPLPGTPLYCDGSFENILEKARYEANIYKESNIDGILIENMHDVPYIKSEKIGPEVVSAMTRVTMDVKKVFGDRKIPFGLQILACGSRGALAVCKATGCDFIRNEGFVFSHIGDEGFIDSNAGDLLRYRKTIDATNVLILNDIKKKHSSHSITQDVSLTETASAAKFFLTDGLVLTGRSTGDSTDITDLEKLYKMKMNIPILIGSGVTRDNLKEYFGMSDGIIIGSHFKEGGHWANELSSQNINDFMDRVEELRKLI